MVCWSGETQRTDPGQKLACSCGGVLGRPDAAHGLRSPRSALDSPASSYLMRTEVLRCGHLGPGDAPHVSLHGEEGEASEDAGERTMHIAML
eukprot:1342031-Rhodomonas_salina.3